MVDVSIIVPVFNHEDYIEQALDSILMQTTKYSYEVLVGEDASTDRSRQVIQNYEAMHPGKIQVFYRDHNMHHERINNAVDLLLKAKGRYIAICEGDDYWTDKNKIEYQVVFLERNKDFFAVAHNCTIVDRNSKPTGIQYPECKEKEYTFGHYASDLFPGQTATILFRNMFKDPWKYDSRLFLSFPIDRGACFSYLCNGRIFCIQKPMSAYRYVTDGGTSYSASNHDDEMTGVEFCKGILKYAYTTENASAIRAAEIRYYRILRTVVLKGIITLKEFSEYVKIIKNKGRLLRDMILRDFNRFVVKEDISIRIGEKNSNHTKRVQLGDVGSDVCVSIICCTYNQEKYIKDALDSFLMQETSFKFEVIVHDDASTDCTREICKSYIKMYPDIFRGILEEENQFSKQNFDFFDRKLIPIARGRYIALCEGDDYWTDKYKLQKQFAFMEGHKDYSACTHSSTILDCRTGKKRQYHPVKRDYTLSEEDIILWNENRYQTASLFCRKECCIRPDIMKIDSIGDYPLALWLLYHGKIFYFKDVMSVYRIMADGSWTKARDSMDQVEIRKKLVIEVDELLDHYNDLTNGKYLTYINRVKRRGETNILSAQGKFKEIFMKYPDVWRYEYKFKSKIALFLRAFIFPMKTGLKKENKRARKK